MRRAILTTLLGLLIAAPAYGAAGPVPPVQGGAGVSTPGGVDNLIAVGADNHTVVMRVRHSDAAVARTRVIPGNYGVPGVTYDGVNTGLSADGSTLVLAELTRAYPPKSTRLQVLHATDLRLRDTIKLPGMVGVDAISPDGRWLYLVDYKGGNTIQYDVRAYDLRRHRLQAKPVVDPREPEEKLQGIPVTRVQSDEGRWAYTLYTGEEPFIHALDTEGRTAVCIDMPASLASDQGALTMKLDGDHLTVQRNSRPVALVDLKSFKVSAAAAAAPKPQPTATPRPQPAAKTDAGPPWALWLLPLVAFGVLAVVARQRRSRHSATSSRAAAGHSG